MDKVKLEIKDNPTSVLVDHRVSLYLMGYDLGEITSPDAAGKIKTDGHLLKTCIKLYGDGYPVAPEKNDAILDELTKSAQKLGITVINPDLLYLTMNTMLSGEGAPKLDEDNPETIEASWKCYFNKV